jgi:hypothetical protein
VPKIKFFFLVFNLLIFNSLVFAQYSVGNDDGFAFSNADYNPLESLTPYFVGNDDGFDFSVLGSWGNEVPLPIELLWFNAECEGSNITLKWATASETNNDFFTIERSFDCINFDIVGTIAGAGNSRQTLHYSFTDAKTFNGIVYYRLKQTDFDGQFEYSNIISANCNDKPLQEIEIYPNPISNELNIEATGNNGVVNFKIINSTGAVVYKSSFIQKTTIQTSKLDTGLYIIKFESGNIFEFKKVIKQ